MIKFTSHFAIIENATFTESNNFGETSGYVEVVVVNSPGSSQRISIKHVSIYNPDNLTKTAIVLLRDDDEYSIISKTSLATDETLVIDQVLVLDSTTKTLNLALLPIAGYFAGGITGSVTVVTADKLVYSTDTTAAQSSANLSQARYGIGSANNSDVVGYFAGGSSTTAGAAVATADKLVYSTDTTAAQSSANLSQARWASTGVSNSGISGYFAGGVTGAQVATADKLVYATDTTAAQSSANLSQVRGFAMGAYNPNVAGYFCGGNSAGGAVVVTADKLTYSNDTTAAQSSANLSQARRAGAGVSNNTLFGYFGGGETGGIDAGAARVATADKLTFSNDTTAAQSSANLSQARFDLGGASNSFESGYFAGGTTGALVATADKLIYSTTITATQSSANLSQARYHLTGVDG